MALVFPDILISNYCLWSVHPPSSPPHSPIHSISRQQIYPFIRKNKTKTVIAIFFSKTKQKPSNNKNSGTVCYNVSNLGQLSLSSFWKPSNNKNSGSVTTLESNCQISSCITPKSSMLVAWNSGRTSVYYRRTFPVLCSTCSWWVTTYVGKPYATMSSNWANSAFHPFEVDKWVVSCNRMWPTLLGWWHLVNAHGVKAGRFITLVDKRVGYNDALTDRRLLYFN